MPKYNIHVCIVSDQPIPNYVPVLDNQFRPQEVILLVTDRMRTKAEALAQTLKTRCGVKTRQIAIQSEYDMQEMEDKVLGELIALDESKENIALNLTGGTKLMALAAYRTFHDAGYPTFYFTATSNEVLLLDNNERLTLQPPKIKIEDYLHLHGYQIAANNQVQRSVPRERQAIGEELIQRHQYYANAITALNGIISDGRSKNRKTLTFTKSQSWGALDDLIDLLASHGLLKTDGDKITFTDEDSLRYTNGGWLEEYTYHIAASLPDIQDIALNVQIENAGNSHQPNELDIAILSHNVLFVLECKTANLKADEKTQNALYKLETLKKLGGLRTRTAFIAYRELPRETRDRAKGADIRIIEQKDLPGFKTELHKWIAQQ
jgi:hypothetical protein